MLWWKLAANDTNTPAGQYILGRRTAKDWANYGRWVDFRGYLSQQDSCVIDRKDQRAMDALGYRLGLSRKQLTEFVSLLQAAGALSKDAFDEGWLSVDDVFNQWQAYMNRKAVNTANRSKRG